MAEATNPQAGVPAVAPSVQSRLAAFLGEPGEQAAPAADETQPETEPAEQEPAPVEATQPDELSPEDLPDDTPEAQPLTADEFEIVHDGKQHKLPRAEVIKLAQQGFDYTQKTQALAERNKAVDGVMQRVSEMEQILPYVASGQAEVAAYKAQLAPYEKVDWVQLATDNPLEYPKYRAQYDLLIQGHNSAAHRVDQALNEFKQRRDEAQTTNLRAQYAKLQELVPEWKDQAKFKAGTNEVHSYLLGQGADPQVLAGLSDALSISIARKAMRYDQLVKSKGEKAKLLQTAPPVARPGVHPSRDAARTDKQTELQSRFKKTGNIKDGAALLATRLKL